MTPSAFEAWPERDQRLALALTQLEDETGPEGFPVADEYDPDMDGWYEAKERVNFAAAARERAEKRIKDAEPGTRLVVVDTRPSA